MTQPTLNFNLPGTGDAGRETPEDATSGSTGVATSTPGEASTSVATSGGEVEDDVATKEPFDAWAKGTEFAEQAYALAVHWYRLGVEDATRHGGPFRTAWEGRGPSLADISAYAGERRWLPGDHPGGPVVTGIPVVYYRLVAPVAVGAALAWIWLWSRLLRITVAVLVAGITLLIVTLA